MLQAKINKKLLAELSALDLPSTPVANVPAAVVKKGLVKKTHTIIVALPTDKQSSVHEPTESLMEPADQRWPSNPPAEHTGNHEVIIISF